MIPPPAAGQGNAAHLTPAAAALAPSRKGMVYRMALLEVNNLKKVYTTRFGGNQVRALSNVSFSVEPG